MVNVYKAAPDIDVLTANIPLPGLGLLANNAFVLHGSDPILVDTGAVIHKKEFLTALESVIDPKKLKWIWLSHTDFDHIGALHHLLDENPSIRVITTFLAVGILSLFHPLPMDRVYFLNPGQKLSVGERTLTAVKPPIFDNPCTTGFHDDKSGVFFSADSFGAVLEKVPQNAGDLSEDELRKGQVFWATVDSPWLNRIDEGAFSKTLDGIRKMEPTMVLSGHLPVAPGNMLERMLGALGDAPKAPPFVGPDQEALQQMLAQMATSGKKD